MSDIGEVITAKVSTQENIHLPRKVCEFLEIKEGDTVAFVEKDGELVLKKATVSVEV